MGKATVPSEPVLLWTCYVFLVCAGIVALALLVAGDVTGKAGGSVLLWKVIRSLKTSQKR